MDRKLLALGCLLVLSAFALGACGPATTVPVPTAPATTAPANPTPKAGMPNPAAAYCEQQGYQSEIRTNADGSQYGVCKFPDGSECDEWAFFRGKCAPGVPYPGPGQTAPAIGMANPASVYCEQQGYQVEIRTDASGGQVGFCKFPDGTECDEWAFFRGECAPQRATPQP